MRYFILSIVILFIVCGCKPEIYPPSQTSDPIKFFPVKVGNWWIFNYYTVEENGEANFNFEELRSVDSIYNNRFRINYTVDSQLVAYISVSGTDGDLNQNFANEPDTLKANIRNSYKKDSFTRITNKIYSGLRNVYTPFGMKKAILVEWESRTETPKDTAVVTKRNYYAENIGPVKEEETKISWSEVHRQYSKTLYTIKDYHLEK